MLLAALGCAAAGLAAGGGLAMPSALLLVVAEGLSAFLAGPRVIGLVALACALLLLLLGPGRHARAGRARAPAAGHA
jgi:hypothetical protein